MRAICMPRSSARPKEFPNQTRRRSILDIESASNQNQPTWRLRHGWKESYAVSRSPARESRTSRKRRAETEQTQRQSTRGPQKFTLAEAFSPFTIIGGEDAIDSDLERGLRAVAFLLHSLSDIGNNDVEGFVAHGLGYVIEHYTDRLNARARNSPGEI